MRPDEHRTVLGPASGTACAARSRAAQATDIPRRADGLELIGRFEGSGFREPPSLARRSDGQVVQLSPLLYAVAEAADGCRRPEAIANDVTRRLGRRVSAANVQFLVERKLRPCGVLAAADGSTPALPKRPPPLTLRSRRRLLHERTVNLIARGFEPMFSPLVVMAVLAVLGIFDAWLFFVHGIAGGLVSALYNPSLLLGVFGAVILATAFHEIGHAAACRYGGARPGAIGAALYLVYPAFYCDVTDAYRLTRAGRLRTDLGGVYFNAIFALLAGAAFFATGEEALLLVAAIQHLIIVQQLLPLLRFDGYYVLSDLTGVPDVLSRIGPIFRSLIPFRRPEPRVAELKPWVRIAVTAYVVTMVPLVLLLLTWLVLGMPRIAATAVDSLGIQAARIEEALGAAEWSLAGLGALKVVALLLPMAAIGLTFGRLGRALARALAAWASQSTWRRIVAVAGTTAIVVLVLGTWWPNGEYEPLRPGDRGTVGDGIQALDDVQTVRAAFTPGEAAQVNPARAEADHGSRHEPRPLGDIEQTPGEDQAGRVVTDVDEPNGSVGETPTETTPTPQSPPEAPPTTAAPPPETDTGATPPTETPSPAPPAPGDDNVARAVNLTDGALVFMLAFDLQLVTEGPVDQMNVAQAYASCEGCRTIAIAVQVLLVMADVQQVVPVNYAEAINYACTACETLAYAWQLVLDTGGEVQLTPEALARLQEIERQLNSLRDSDASLFAIQDEADRLMEEMRDTVLTGTEPVAPPTPTQPPATGEDSEPLADPPVEAPDDGTAATPLAEDEADTGETTTTESTPTTTPDPPPSTTPEAAPPTTTEPAPTTTTETAPTTTETAPTTTPDPTTTTTTETTPTTTPR